MKKTIRCASGCATLILMSVLFAVVALNCAGEACAIETLVYSFEDGLNGFAANSGGTYTQDTIGATNGTHSLKVSAPVGPGFFGGLTSTLPAAIGDPPGVDYVVFDMTLTSPFGPGPPNPGFAVVGVTVFGKTQNDPSGAGLQAQFEDEEHIDGKAAGTYEVRIDLDRTTHPLTFAYPQTFNQVFGAVGSGPNDLIPSGFEFFFNKQVGVDYPLTVYIDNVRVGRTVAAVDGDYNGNGKVDAADYVVWRKNLNLPGGSPSVGDGTGDGNVNQADYDYWRARFGNGSVGGSSLGNLSVPEPSSAISLLFAISYCSVRRRKLAF